MNSVLVLQVVIERLVVVDISPPPPPMNSVLLLQVVIEHLVVVDISPPSLYELCSGAAGGHRAPGGG